MKQFRKLAALLLMTAMLPQAEAAAADASKSFLAGTSAFNGGDYTQALAHFETALSAGSMGPAVHYNIGVCHYRLGNFKRAGEMFDFLANEYPAMRGLALYNLGLVRLEQEQVNEARRLFEQARVDPSDAKVSRLAARMLARMERSVRAPTEEPSPWYSFVDLGVGHDDNVALIDETALPAGQSIDSTFTEMLAVISGPLSSSPGFRFDGTAYAVRYNDADEFDQSALRLGGVYAWRSGSWLMEAGPHLNYNTLNGDGFEQRIGAGIRMRRNLRPSLSLGIYIVHDDIRAAETQFSWVEGSRGQLGLTLDRYDDRGRLTLGYQLERNDRADPGISPDGHRVSLRHRYTMSPNWSTDVELAYRARSYDGLTTARDENRGEISLGLVRYLANGWQVNGNYRWHENDSKVDIYSYTRKRLVMGLTKKF